MAVEYLQGELQRVTKTLDLQRRLVNGCLGEFWACLRAGNAAILRPMLMLAQFHPPKQTLTTILGAFPPIGI